MATQFGYFLIADITGYTRYLSGSELDHAQQTLAALLNLLIKKTRPPLIISRLAGDAVISYGLRDSFGTGQTFVEMIEDTYVSFRRLIEVMVRNTSCPCNACRNIGDLDLKFFVHFGEFSVQKLDAHDELVGSDVNLIHRLLKNHVTELTGLKAYTLYTDAAIRQLGMEQDAGGLAELTETYEHLGAVKVRVADMHPVWERKREAMQVRVGPTETGFRFDTEIRASPEAIWDFLVNPSDFNVLLGGDRTTVARRQGSRIAEGTIYQCHHGKSMILNTVVGWHPFEQLVVQYPIPIPIKGTTGLVEIRLEPTAAGTHLTEIWSRASGPFIGRLVANVVLGTIEARFRKYLGNFVAHVEAGVAERPRADEPSSTIGAADVDAAARASLASG